MYHQQDNQQTPPRLALALLLLPCLLLSGSPNTHLRAAGLAATYAGSEQNGGNNKLHFFDGREHQQWQTSSTHADKGFPKPIQSQWINLPTYLDAAVYIGTSSPMHANKLLFFKNNEYWRWDVTSGKMDRGYPKRVSDGFPGLPRNIEAAVYAPYHHSQRKDKLYFFQRGQYWRWDIADHHLDKGYPKRITLGWRGIPRGDIDMAVYSGTHHGSASSKIFLFQGNLYYRWDINTDRLDEGYPKSVQHYWPGLRF